MADAKFVYGLFCDKRENSPDFIITSLSFTEKFIDYLKENFNAKGYVNVDVLLSSEGKQYAKLNDWKPTEKLEEGQGRQYAKLNDWKPTEKLEEGQDREDVDFSEIPF